MKAASDPPRGQEPAIAQQPRRHQVSTPPRAWLLEATNNMRCKGRPSVAAGLLTAYPRTGTMGPHRRFDANQLRG